jgi:glycosyltransferase involved in cell wall biosynthesis
MNKLKKGILKRNIRYVHKGYPEDRNILYAHKINNFKFAFKKEFDFFKLMSAVYFKLFKKVNYILHNLHYNPFGNRVYHFFNVISLSNNNWVTTFETYLPRLIKGSNYLNKIGVRALASENCKKIIALSNCALNIQKEFLQKQHSNSLDLIMKKSIVLLPPQKLIIDSVSTKIKFLNNKTIVFTLVGADFFRKGGAETLKAFAKIKSEGYIDWHLNIVSSLNYGDYASKTTDLDKLAALKLIDSNSNITLYQKISNHDVIELYKKSHIGLLPTWADTFGYTVLEAQSCGCPVISTDIRALPEVNNDICGWVINVRKDNIGNGVLGNKSERALFSNILANKLYENIASILNNKEQILIKSKAAIQRIKKEHDLEVHAQKLQEIYNETYIN